MRVSKSGYYYWVKSKNTITITNTDLMLYRSIKLNFEKSRSSLGNRAMVKKLRKEGFNIGRYKVRRIMKKLGLKVTQRLAYKVISSKNTDKYSRNVLDQKFNPSKINKIWCGDITYINTTEGWIYLSVVIDLYSRRIIGWSIDKNMKTDLVIKSIKKALNTRDIEKGLIFHSDRGSQYTSTNYQNILLNNNIISSMSGTGACWDNAVNERFFGSLKHDWLFKVNLQNREKTTKDIIDYIKYYNLERLHSTINNLSPVEFERAKDENSIKKVSSFT